MMETNFNVKTLFSFIFVFYFWCFYCVCGQLTQDDDYTLAYVNLTYFDPVTRSIHTEKEEIGKFSRGRVDDAAGIVVHVRTRNGSSNYGCELPFENPAILTAESSSLQSTTTTVATAVPWIALIRRGKCSFEKKISNAVSMNATAVVVYDDRYGPTQKMRQGVPNIVAIFISQEEGEKVADLVDNGTKVHMYITVGTHQSVRFTNINRTSVLFVSISFIVLMIISLAWLVFYYVQRFRFINAKDQLAKRLCSAAKKALTKIPVKTLKDSDLGQMECCAVCIELYKVSEVVRILPCKHQFHKSCVDPWLLEHRTCPMCKMDILKYYGLVFAGSQESILQIEVEENPSYSAAQQQQQQQPRSSGDRPHLVVSLPPIGFDVVSLPYVEATRQSQMEGVEQSRWPRTSSSRRMEEAVMSSGERPLSENRTSSPDFTTLELSFGSSPVSETNVEVVVKDVEPHRSDTKESSSCSVKEDEAKCDKIQGESKVTIESKVVKGGGGGGGGDEEESSDLRTPT